MKNTWQQNYDLLKKYYEKNGNIGVPVGSSLYSWLSAQKYAKRGIRGTISLEQIAMLERLGIKWGNSNDEKWMSKYSELKEFYKKNGHVNVPIRTKLYTWLSAQKYSYEGKRGKLTEIQIELLEELGVDWLTERDKNWSYYYSHAKRYYEKYEKLNVPMSYIDEDGCKLGQWITYQRKAYRYRDIDMEHKPLISDDEIALLDKIGMKWDITWLGRRVSIPELIIYYYILKLRT